MTYNMILYIVMYVHVCMYASTCACMHAWIVLCIYSCIYTSV